MQKFWLTIISLVLMVHPAFAQSVSVSGVTTLQMGKESQLTLHLATAAGLPMALSDLKEVHKAKIHLLVVDDSMTDYQHIHPVQGHHKGQYVFSFTPKTAHNYTLWADITPLKGQHQYLKTMLAGTEPCKTACIDTTPSLKGAADGLKGELTFDDPLMAGEAAMGNLVITDKKGNPAKDLEPVMGAFAHIVGFYTDKPGVAHIHPMGEEPKNDQARGGPEMMFHLEPEYAGTMKLFAQVKRGGKEIFIPFTLKISP